MSGLTGSGTKGKVSEQPILYASGEEFKQGRSCKNELAFGWAGFSTGGGEPSRAILYRERSNPDRESPCKKRITLKLDGSETVDDVAGLTNP